MPTQITSCAEEATIHMDGSERVYPCRCGETHRGEYGHYDYCHHICFHDAGLFRLADDSFVCVECGKPFHVVEPKP